MCIGSYNNKRTGDSIKVNKVNEILKARSRVRRWSLHLGSYVVICVECGNENNMFLRLSHQNLLIYVTNTF